MSYMYPGALASDLPLTTAISQRCFQVRQSRDLLPFQILTATGKVAFRKVTGIPPRGRLFDVQDKADVK